MALSLLRRAARSMDSLLARSVLRYQQQHSSPNPGKWALRSGAGAHRACSLRPLSGRPAWPNATSSSIALQSFPIPARQRPLVGLGRQAACAALRNGTAAAAVMGIKYSCASASRNNRSSASYQFPATVTDHLTFGLLHSPISQNHPTPFFLSRPAWQYPGATALMAGRRRCTSTRMRPADLPRGFELKRRAVCQPNLQFQRR